MSSALRQFIRNLRLHGSLSLWARKLSAHTTVHRYLFLIACGVLAPSLSEAVNRDSVADTPSPKRAELHVVAVADGLMPNGTKRPWGESSPHAPAEVHVNVTVLDVPVNLLLVASSWPVNPTSKPITWKIHASPGVNISRAVIIGDEPQSVEGDIRREQWTVTPTSKDLWLPHTPKYHDIFTKKVSDLFGMAPVTYQFFEHGGKVLVDGITTQCEYRFGQDINKELENRKSSRSLHALEALSKSTSIKDREQAAIGYRLHCASAVPYLSRLIEDPEPSVRQLVIATLNSVNRGTDRFDPILKVLEDPDKSVRMSAIDAEVSMRDLRALPILIKTLRHTDQSLRLAVSQALAALAPQIFYHKLGIVLRDEDLDLRKDAFKVFVPDLIVALEDQDPTIKINMARILSTLGPHSEAATPSLVRLIHSDSLEVKKAAALALQRIGVTSAESVLSLVDAREAAPDDLRDVLDNTIQSNRSLRNPRVRAAVAGYFLRQ